MKINVLIIIFADEIYRERVKLRSTILRDINVPKLKMGIVPQNQISQKY